MGASPRPTDFIASESLRRPLGQGIERIQVFVSRSDGRSAYSADESGLFNMNELAKAPSLWNSVVSHSGCDWRHSVKARCSPRVGLPLNWNHSSKMTMVPSTR